MLVSIALAVIEVVVVSQRLAAQAPAAEVPVEASLLDWTAPSSCPSRTIVEAEIERILGRRPEGGPFATVTIVVRGGRHTAELGVGSAPSRRRRIEASSCEALVRATALIVALEIDPDALSVEVADAPPRVQSPASEPPSVPTPIELEGGVDLSRVVPADPARALGSPFAPWRERGPHEPDVRFLVGVAPIFDAGAMPDLAPGVWLGATLRLGGLLEIGLEGRFLPEQRARLAPRPQVGADVTMLAGRLRVGAGFVLARVDVVTLEAAPLAALELGSVSAAPFGLMTPLSGAALWWALDLGLELRAFFFEALGVFVRGEAQIALRRSSFLIEGYTTPVFRASEAGFVGVLGVMFRTS